MLHSKTNIDALYTLVFKREKQTRNQRYPQPSAISRMRADDILTEIPVSLLTAPLPHTILESSSRRVLEVNRNTAHHTTAEKVEVHYLAEPPRTVCMLRILENSIGHSGKNLARA